MNSGKYSFNYQGESLEIAYFIRLGSTKTLLYFHCGACSSEDFIKATNREELKKYTIVSFDFPGCVNSYYPKHESLNIDDLVEITKSIIQTLKLHNITLIGHSTGGLVALRYILKYGGIDGFISVEGNVSSENCVFSRKVAAIKNFEEYKNTAWPELHKSLKSSKNKGFQKWAKTLEKASAKAFYDYCDLLVKYSDDPATLNEYLSLKIPHIYIYGSENKENLTFLKKLEAKGNKIAEIPKSSHFPFYDNPEEFYGVVANFLSTF